VNWLDRDQLLREADAAGACGRQNSRQARRIGLPTEAEWEFAAPRRNFDQVSVYGDGPGFLQPDKSCVGFSENAGLTVHPVGLKLPNQWGLYDTEGNVWEWCLDWYGPTLPGGIQVDPKGASCLQSYRVIK